MNREPAPASAKEDARGHQGGAAPTIRHVLRRHEPPSDDDAVQDRILTLLRRHPRWGGERWAWWRLRQTVGGSVPAERFRMVVDALLDEGVVVEAYEAVGGRQTPRHLVVLASRWHDYEWGDLIEVHGREDVLQDLGLVG